MVVAIVTVLARLVRELSLCITVQCRWLPGLTDQARSPGTPVAMETPGISCWMTQKLRKPWASIANIMHVGVKY